MRSSKFIYLAITVHAFLLVSGCNLPSRQAGEVPHEDTQAQVSEEYEQLPGGLDKTATALEEEYLSVETPTPPEIPTIESQEPTTIAPGVPGFPDDTPIPAGWVPVPVPPALEAQGYVIAYQFDGFAEEALRDLLAVMLATPGWIMDEVKPQAYASTFIQPFGNMTDGFVAYAFITSTPEAVELDSIDGCIIALQAGRYE
jgi:hypothetical protein